MLYICITKSNNNDNSTTKTFLFAAICPKYQNCVHTSTVNFRSGRKVAYNGLVYEPLRFK